jgi:uncharacterized protein (DUF1330 family)
MASLLAAALVLGGLGVAQAQAQDAPAFVLVELDVKDADGFAEYGAQVPATIAQHGGAVIANAVAETIEGMAPQGRVIIIRFASVADAEGWLTSAEYGAIKGIRHRTANTRQLVVEGLPAD